MSGAKVVTKKFVKPNTNLNIVPFLGPIVIEPKLTGICIKNCGSCKT